MPLRILIDLQGVQSGSRLRGIGRYSLALAQGIARNAGKNEISILLNGLFFQTIDEIRGAFVNILAEDRFLVFTSPGPVSGLDTENDWRRRAAEILREHVIDLLSPDVLLISSMFEGSGDNAVTSLGTLGSVVPTAVVLYDLIPLSDPDRYLASEKGKLWYREKLESLRRADLLLSISQSAAREAITALGIEPIRVTNISSAANSIFTSANLSADDAASIAKKYGIVGKYLMHTGVFEARKNFQGLIRAYAAIPTPVRAQYQLVLVCNLDSGARQELTELAANGGLAHNELVLTGFVTDDELVALYTACHLFVFPSFHEGFGLPPLEAMQCGTATIGSNATSLPEVIGRGDALFDPTFETEMTSLIMKALTDTQFYQSLKAHAANQAANFSWDKTARRAIVGLEGLVDRSRISAPKDHAAVKRRKMLEAIADISYQMPPDDLALLALATSIEVNNSEVSRLIASAAVGGAPAPRVERPS
jgi:glycosyltransferase involved in cell wall biosynthesis